MSSYPQELLAAERDMQAEGRTLGKVASTGERSDCRGCDQAALEVTVLLWMG
jgi:hypothetical protein